MMFTLLAEYGSGAPLACRWQCRDLMVALSGYRRRLELHADGYQRLIDLFLFATPEAAEDALTIAVSQGVPRAGNPALALALLVREGDALGSPTVVVRRGRAVSPTGAQVCWRDHLHTAAPVTELW